MGSRKMVDHILAVRRSVVHMSVAHKSVASKVDHKAVRMIGFDFGMILMAGLS